MMIVHLRHRRSRSVNVGELQRSHRWTVILLSRSSCCLDGLDVMPARLTFMAGVDTVATEDDCRAGRRSELHVALNPLAVGLSWLRACARSPRPKPVRAYP